MSDEPATSVRAASSLKLGLLSLLLSAFTGLPAIVQGVRGLRDIGRSSGRLKGRALAWAGIATGSAGTGMGALLLVFVVEWVQDQSDRVT